MNYTVIDNAIFEDENLKHTEFRVLAYLIRNYNTSMGYSFPTREQIIKSCKVNKDTLNNVLKSLEEKGYITRKNNPSKAGRNTIYLIHKYLVISNSTPSQKVEEEKEGTIIEPNEEEIITDEKETEDLIARYYAGEVQIPELDVREDAKDKVDTLSIHLLKKPSLRLRTEIVALSWEEIVKVDIQVSDNKQDKFVTEKFMLNAIADNKIFKKRKVV